MGVGVAQKKRLLISSLFSDLFVPFVHFAKSRTQCICFRFHCRSFFFQFHKSPTKVFFQQLFVLFIAVLDVCGLSEPFRTKCYKWKNRYLQGVSKNLYNYNPWNEWMNEILFMCKTQRFGNTAKAWLNIVQNQKIHKSLIIQSILNIYKNGKQFWKLEIC